MITPEKFIEDLRKAFREDMLLPFAVWRSITPAGEEVKVPHCMFGAVPQLKEGQIVSFSKETLHCGGGKLYCGFMPKNPGIPNFVANKEHYKQTPEMVHQYIDDLHLELTDYHYLNLARIDKIHSWDGVEGIFFLAEPDMIAGLCAWAFYDNNASDAVSCPFASGCCAVVTLLVNGNKAKSRSTYLGMMDISARPHIGRYEQSFAIPMPRLKEMVFTLHKSCLWEAPAWQKLKERSV